MTHPFCLPLLANSSAQEFEGWGTKVPRLIPYRVLRAPSGMTPEHWVLGVGCVHPFTPSFRRSSGEKVSFSSVPQDKPFAVARRGPSHQFP